MSYVSNKLTHWAGRSLATDDDRYELLTRAIIGQKRLRFNKCPLAFGTRYGGLKKETFGLPMVCFTDAPLSRCEPLCNRYSKFGIVFNKPHLANCLTTPVGYSLHPYTYNAFNDLYHTINGMRKEFDGKTIPQGVKKGKKVSADRMLEQLTRLIAFSQDYSGSEFVFNSEMTPEGYEMPLDSNPLDSQITFFEDPDVLYFEREWRMIAWPDMLIKPYPWLILQDKQLFFQFTDEFVAYLVMPREYCVRLSNEREDVFASYKPSEIPNVIAFEDVVNM